MMAQRSHQEMIRFRHTLSLSMNYTPHRSAMTILWFLLLATPIQVALGIHLTWTLPMADATSPSIPYNTLSSIAPVTALLTEKASPATLVLQPRTTAPPMYNRLGVRQECFNDQGFRVDCATWTGYYYTWGPPGNPYEGGPGEGGGGGGNVQTAAVYTGGNSVTNFPNTPLFIGCFIIALARLL